MRRNPNAERGVVLAPLFEGSAFPRRPRRLFFGCSLIQKIYHPNKKNDIDDGFRHPKDEEKRIERSCAVREVAVQNHFESPNIRKGFEQKVERISEKTEDAHNGRPIPKCAGHVQGNEHEGKCERDADKSHDQTRRVVHFCVKVAESHFLLFFLPEYHFRGVTEMVFIFFR